MIKTKYIRIKVLPLIAVAAFTAIFTSAYPQKGSFLLNLTTRINTEGDDYAPSLTEDGSTAVFNSRMPEEKSHNIFICKNTNGLWGDPYPIFEINTDSNEETPFISADGKTIIFASDRPGGFSSPTTSDGKKRITFDLYITRLVSGKWTVPEILKGNVNTNMNERAPGLSADGKTLFFTRWPYNNPGKSKLYSAKLEDGGFTEAKEIHGPINTGNFEIGLRPSYKSGKYYFASRKPGGFGGWDIYYTTLTSKGFTASVNAGEDINSPYDDMYYSESKINSMICSDRAGGYGKFDLYSSLPAEKVSVPALKKDYKESKISTLLITARDRKSGKLLKQVNFNILLIGDREKESMILRKIEIKSNSKGFFKLYPKDDIDSVVVEPLSKKYLKCSVKINVTHGQSQEIIIYPVKKTSKSKKNACAETETKIISEKKVNENADIAYIKTIYFKSDSSGIAPEYITGLHSLVEYMRNNPESQLTISGYSDPAGSFKLNEKLSMKRANSVADFIKSLDIAADRITVKWFGETKSVSWRKGSRYNSLDRKVELNLTNSK